MLISMAALFGALAYFFNFKDNMIKKYIGANANPAVSVSTVMAEYKTWQPTIKAVGSLRAARGVVLSTEISGIVRDIYFTPGTAVIKGAPLLSLNADIEKEQLKALSAAVELAKTTYERDKKQFEIKAVNRAVLDNDIADLKSKEAQLSAQEALIAKKDISAPFSGKIGISLVDTGQYLNPGDKIASLQALDLLHVDFSVPQQLLSKVNSDQTIIIKTDLYPNVSFIGKIIAIDSMVDLETRNILVEASIENQDHLLLPGMFVSVEVNTEQPKQVLMVPQSSITFNPYGETVYLLKEDENKNLFAVQKFIETGEVNGNSIAILSGLNDGDIVVSSGNHKVKNGSKVVVHND
jgi:membrane fusion protein (multidrug efflux system)